MCSKTIICNEYNLCLYFIKILYREGTQFIVDNFSKYLVCNNFVYFDVST